MGKKAEFAVYGAALLTVAIGNAVPVERLLGTSPEPDGRAIYDRIGNDIRRGYVATDPVREYGVPVRYSTWSNCIHASVRVTVNGAASEWVAAQCKGSLPTPGNG